VLLAFSVLPAWWETAWARLGAILLIVAASAALARVVVQRRLHVRLRRVQQEHALETERARIARDLHDELGASLTEVGLLAERLANVSPAQLGSDLSGLAWRTRRIATDLSSIVWTMKGSNSSLDRLAEFLRQYAERLLRNTGTRCIVRGVERIGPIPLAPDPQHHMLAAAKEAITNVLKHARATEASLTMDYRDGAFELAIEDNGVGFDPAAATVVEGNGLRNLRARVAEIGGTCDIVTAPGRGTRITLRIPLPARG
jgi:signal transduction histidine kinase